MTEASQNLTGAGPQTRRGWLEQLLNNRQLMPVLTLLLLLAAWEAFVAIFEIRSYLLPAPSEVFAALLKHIRLLWRASLFTVQNMLVGYFLAVVLGVLLALPIAFSSLMQRTVYPVMVMSQLVPKVALAPIFVVWFGFGMLPKVLVVFLLSFFAVVLNGVSGLRSIDPEIISLTRSTGASALDTFLKVRLPHALPAFFTGFKLAAISATVGAVIGEFIGSDRGLGYTILTANGDLQTDLSFASIVMLTILGLILYYAVELIERLAIPWHVSQRVLEDVSPN